MGKASIDTTSKGPTEEKGDSAKSSLVAKRKNYLITIGIDDYDNEEIQKLQGCCENDCKVLENIFVKQYGFTTLKSFLNKEATKKELEEYFENLQDHEDFSRNCKGPAPNLIIYYSGHGKLLPVSKTNRFFWVPYDFPAKKKLSDADSRDLYGFSTQLINAVGELNYHHLLFIIDSCHSGGAIANTSFHSNNPNVTRDDVTEEQSCWALCSSGELQKSYLSEYGHSFFTWHLIQKLQNNLEREITTELLFTQLSNSDVITKNKKQRVFFDKIGLVPNNTGKWYLKAAKEDDLLIKSARNSLSQGIPKFLNFTREKTALLSNGKHFIHVVKGGSDSALKVLACRLQIESDFPGFLDDVKFIDEASIPPMGEKILQLFSIIGIMADDRKSLVTTLYNKLNAKDVVLPLFFEKDAAENTTLINDVIGLLEDVEKIGATEYKFFFYAFDQYNTNHSGVKQLNNASFEVNILPVASMVSQQDVVDWYSNQIKLLNKTKSDEYLVLQYFNKVFTPFKQNYQPALPAKAITSICVAAKCPDLAKSLFESTELLNY
jgi:hypothetical protein